MARVHVVIPHTLDIDTAEARLRAFLASPTVRDRLGDGEVVWGKHNVELTGEGFSGRCHVTARDVEVDLELGGLLGLFSGAAKAEIEKRLGDALR